MNLRRCRNEKQLSSMVAVAAALLRDGQMTPGERAIFWHNLGHIAHCAELVGENCRRAARIETELEAIDAEKTAGRELDLRRALRVLRAHRRLRRRRAFVWRYTLTMPWPARWIELARTAAALNAGGSPA